MCKNLDNHLNHSNNLNLSLLQHRLKNMVTQDLEENTDPEESTAHIRQRQRLAGHQQLIRKFQLDLLNHSMSLRELRRHRTRVSTQDLQETKVNTQRLQESSIQHLQEMKASIQRLRGIKANIRGIKDSIRHLREIQGTRVNIRHLQEIRVNTQHHREKRAHIQHPRSHLTINQHQLQLSMGLHLTNNTNLPDHS